MPIVDVAPGNLLEVENEPVGRVAIHGRGNVLRIGRNATVRCNVWIRGDDSTVHFDDDCHVDGLVHVIRGGAHIRIGRRTTAVSVGISMHEPGEITIGEDCMFSSDIHMDVSDVHPIYDRKTGLRLNPPKPIRIADRVWIGTRVLVMKGAQIGAGSVIGAGSIVIGEIPPDCIAAGTPAKVLRRDVLWRRDLDEPTGLETMPALRRKAFGRRRGLPSWLSLHTRGFPDPAA